MNPPRLSPREKEILSRLIRAQKRDVIAADLGISARTVRFHLENARRKLRAQTTLEAVIFFVRTPAILASLP